LIDDLNVCEDESYLPTSEGAELKQRGWHVLKIMNGYLRYLRDCKTGSSLDLHEAPVPYGDSDDELETWLANLDFPS
jgi:hypothetical protein